MEENRDRHVHVAFVGNPNCGKTTLFNAVTGAKLKVANWPGVTVEKYEGNIEYEGYQLKLVDTPGIYSLSCYTIEEQVTRSCVQDDDIEVIVNVVDASCLERNLYLTLQLLELGKPVILALNMMDIVKERGLEIDLHRLPEMLGDIPVVPVSAARRTGLDILMHAVVHHYEEGPKEDVMNYGSELEEKLSLLGEMMKTRYPSHSLVRWHAIKLLERDEQVTKEHPLQAIVAEDEAAQVSDLAEGAAEGGAREMQVSGASEGGKEDARVPGAAEGGADAAQTPAQGSGQKVIQAAEVIGNGYEKEIIQAKYKYIEEILRETLFHKERKAAQTDRVDAVLTHPVWGVPVFLCIMALVFFLTFAVGDFLKGGFETALDWFSEGARSLLLAVHVSDWLISLVVDGVIAGVGGILTFLPNIFILFLALGILEDSGYMARVAYVMDNIMGKAGLSGRAFLPMILGFGCTVPAIMATRALETEYDRRKVMVITPFMSCSARLPVYVLFSGMFFPNNPVIPAFSMYVIGLVTALLVARVANVLEKGRINDSLLIELPEYKRPNGRVIRTYVWNKLKDYLTKAGTTIFLASIVIWFVLNFGPSGMVEDAAASFGASIGRFLVPVMAPAGLGMWQIVVALISGISAKEVVVSSFAVLFGVTNANSAAGMQAIVDNIHQFDPSFGPLNAFCLMLFVLFYVPCAATIGTIRKESGSWKFTLSLMAFEICFAWLASTLVFQIGRLFL